MLSRKSSRFLLFAFMMFLYGQPSPAADFLATPSLSTRYEYNDNIFFDPDHADRKGDSIITLTPALAMSEETENARARVQARFDIKEYHKYDDLDTIDKSFSGDTAYSLSPRAGVSGGLSWVQDSGIEKDILTTGLLLDRKKRVRKDCSLAGYYQISEVMRADLAYGHQEETFASSENTDDSSDQVSLTLSRDIGRYLANTTAFVDLYYRKYGYEESLLTTVDYYSVDVGCTTMMNENLSLSLAAGPHRTVSRFDVPFWMEGFLDKRSVDNGYAGQVSLDYKGETTTMSFLASHDIAMVSGRSSVAERTTINASASHRHRDKGYVSFSAVLYLNKARHGRPSTEEVDEKSLSLSPRLVYHLTRDVDLSASYTYTFLKDFNTDATYTRQILSAVFSFRYPIFK
jgi:hypothetical protein